MVAGTELRGKGGLMETGEGDWVNPSDLADSSTVLILFFDCIPLCVRRRYVVNT